jgi:hypothetical protein
MQERDKVVPKRIGSVRARKYKHLKLFLNQSFLLFKNSISFRLHALIVIDGWVTKDTLHRFENSQAFLLEQINLDFDLF